MPRRASHTTAQDRRPSAQHPGQPPHRRTAAPAHRRTAAPPHQRTSARAHERTSAPKGVDIAAARLRQLPYRVGNLRAKWVNARARDEGSKYARPGTQEGRPTRTRMPIVATRRPRRSRPPPQGALHVPQRLWGAAFHVKRSAPFSASRSTRAAQPPTPSPKPSGIGLPTPARHPVTGRQRARAAAAAAGSAPPTACLPPPQPAATTSSHAAPAAPAAASSSMVAPSARRPAANAAIDASTTSRSAARP